MGNRVLPAAGFFLVSLVHCGGSTKTDPGGVLPDSGCVQLSPRSDVPRAPTLHRPASGTCSPSRCYLPEAGGACRTDSDCTVDSGSSYLTERCLHGACTFDRCMSDSDCTTDEICSCSSGYCSATSFHLNVCIPATCHVDSDCGDGGYCSPNVGYCGQLEQYNCVKPSDPCIDPTSDCSCTGSSGSVPAACVYDPSVKQFVCGQASTCAG